ncbi:type IV secretion system protein [Kiloniella laminariae]|uniref:Type IV secretion system protein n=1 Tax=Kiloniella laminariae TaxID=454162 RepID=A0ABT4LPM5_9PROT|nr:type IV secretion system protein [Kiloniella laminariae]MCZ4283087.1 type IV secretion system protein [Kiloniella laminariae]
MGKLTLRHMGSLLLFLGVLMMLSDYANAAVAAEDIASRSYFAQSLYNVETSLNTVMDSIVNGNSIYTRHIRVLFFGSLVLFIVFSVTKYMFVGDIGVIIQSGVYAMLVVVIYGSYSFITTLIWEWLNEVGATLQLAMLGSDGLFAPAEYITDVVSLIILDDNSAWYEDLEQKIAVAILFAGTTVLISVASFFTAAFPMIGFIVIKPLGIFLVPTLFVERFSGFFDGFLKLLIGFGLYVIFGRIMLSVVALLIGAYMNVPFGRVPGDGQILIKVDGATDYLFLVGILLLSVALLFSIPAFIGKILGGGSFSMSGDLGSLARKAATFGRR